MEVEEIVQQTKSDIEQFLEKNPDGTIVIRWATATGKSKLSILLSDFFDCEIISSDSRQIFRKMNIGTDKIPDSILQRVPHYQINIVNPDETYTAGQRKEDSEKHIENILSRGKSPFIVGGTGLYIDTIYKNFSMPDCSPNYVLRKELEEKEQLNPWYLYSELQKVDPEEAQKLHPNSLRYLIRALEIYYTLGKTKTEPFSQQTVKHPLLMLGLWREKEETNRRINARIKEMFTAGLVDEVKSLLEEGYSKELQSMQGIGYKEIIGYLEGEYSLDKAEELLKKNTHHLAKKQRTWFRRYIVEGQSAPYEKVTYKVYHLE